MTPDDQTDVIGNDLGEVALCDCGGVNLTIGAVTLHLQPEELEDFQVLATAAVEIAAQAREAETPTEPPALPAPRKDKLGRLLH